MKGEKGGWGFREDIGVRSKANIGFGIYLLRLIDSIKVD